MGGKDDELDEESLARIRLVAQRKRQLEDNAELVREDIRRSFDRLRESLLSRERQLLRQVDAISRQRVSLVQLQSGSEQSCPRQSLEEASLLADFDSEAELAERILNFGLVRLSNGAQVSDSEPYAPEEYLEAGEDLVSFDKSLKSEADELDASSVLRRRSASVRNGFASAILSSSLVASAECGAVQVGCKACEACDSATGQDFSFGAEENATTSEQCNDSPANLKIKRNPKNTPQKVNEERSHLSSPVEDKPVTVKEEGSNLLEKDEINESKRVETVVHDETSASKSAENCTANLAPQKVKDEDTEHPIQIQQWLRQILVETETEPIIHEIGQFSKTPNTRLYREFPVET